MWFHWSLGDSQHTIVNTHFEQCWASDHSYPQCVVTQCRKRQQRGNDFKPEGQYVYLLTNRFSFLQFNYTVTIFLFIQVQIFSSFSTSKLVFEVTVFHVLGPKFPLWVESVHIAVLDISVLYFVHSHLILVTYCYWSLFAYL